MRPAATPDSGHYQQAQSPPPAQQLQQQQQQQAPPQFAPPPFPQQLQNAPYPQEKPPAAAAAQTDLNNPANLVGGAPPPAHFVGAVSTSDDVGTFNGGSYRISHRDTNTILTIQLAMGAPLHAKPGTLRKHPEERRLY